MRVYILERSTKQQLLKFMAAPVEVAAQLTHGQRIMSYLVTDETGVPRSVIGTIPEIAMWIGHEAALMEHLEQHLEHMQNVVHSPGTPYHAQMGEYRKLAQRQEILRKAMWLPSQCDWPMTDPISKVSVKVLRSHRASFIAEAPANRMGYYPGITDLSEPYLAHLEG